MNSVHSISIACDYIFIDHKTSECATNNLVVKNESEIVKSISGNFFGIVDYKQIKTFRIDSSPELEYLPSGIEKFFSALERIIITETGLKVLRSGDLRNLTKLKQVVIARNILTEIEENSFEFNADIESIDFSENKISSIPRNILKPLRHLKSIDLSENVCINETANDPIEINTLKQRINNFCSHDDVSTGQLTFAFSFLVLILLAILFLVLLVNCFKYIIN